MLDDKSMTAMMSRPSSLVNRSRDGIRGSISARPTATIASSRIRDGSVLKWDGCSSAKIG